MLVYSPPIWSEQFLAFPRVGMETKVFATETLGKNIETAVVTRHVLSYYRIEFIEHQGRFV